VSNIELIVVDNGASAPVEKDKKISKRAFQNRFPKTSNGISTKYDRMTRFLSDDGYANLIGVSGEALYDVRELIETGKNRLDSSQHVDYASSEAAEFLFLLTQPFVPVQFRLTQEEMTKMLNDPILDSERYKS
jgi:hypothetical protein